MLEPPGGGEHPAEESPGEEVAAPADRGPAATPRRGGPGPRRRTARSASSGWARRSASTTPARRSAPARSMATGFSSRRALPARAACGGQRPTGRRGGRRRPRRRPRRGTGRTSRGPRPRGARRRPRRRRAGGPRRRSARCRDGRRTSVHGRGGTTVPPRPRRPAGVAVSGVARTRFARTRSLSAARTVTKSRVQPSWYWFAGRFWPGTPGVIGPPGAAATLNCTHSGLMSSSMAVVVPAPTSAPARSRRERRHRAGVEQVAGRVLAERAAGHRAPASECGPPCAQVGDLRGGLSIGHQWHQVLTDAGHLLTGHRQSLTPDADVARAVDVDDQAGVAGLQRDERLAVEFDPAGSGVGLEAPVEGGEQDRHLVGADGGARCRPRSRRCPGAGRSIPRGGRSGSGRPGIGTG